MPPPSTDAVVQLATAVAKCLSDLAQAVNRFAVDYSTCSAETPIPAITQPVKTRNPNALLNSHEVAELIGISENAIRVWRSKGTRGPKFIMIGKFPRYRLADVKEWLNDHERQPVEFKHRRHSRRAKSGEDTPTGE